MLNKKLRTELPAPINPIISKLPKPHKLDTDVKGRADWKHWQHIETVELWQALLLSLDIGPPGNGWLLDNGTGTRPGEIPYDYLDKHSLTDEFVLRCRILRNRLETQFARGGMSHNVELTEFIGLPLFASWALEFEWERLPPELATLAHKWNEKRDVVQGRKAASMTPAPQAAPASEPVTPAAKPAAKGVTKAQILTAFGTILIRGKKQETVSNAMENGYVWAVRARLSQGTRGRGGHESQWCPVLMAIELHERKFATKAALTRAFLAHQFLSGWRSEWMEQSEDLSQ